MNLNVLNRVKETTRLSLSPEPFCVPVNGVNRCLWVYDPHVDSFSNLWKISFVLC